MIAGPAILRVEQVVQSFRSGFFLTPKTILHDLSFQVPGGSLFGFLGPNGAGKTTLIHLAAGIKKPKSGHVFVTDLPADQPEAKQKLGYLPERPYFYEHLTGAQLLKYFGTLSGMKTSHIQSRIPVVLERVGMMHAKDMELRNYSKGMLQRVGIAQAILHEPELLILDEPMSGLDPIGRREIRELMVDLSREGRTVFFSTHVIPDVEAICDQVALIKHGKLILEGKLRDVVQKHDLGVEATLEELTQTQERKLQEQFSSILVERYPGSVKVQLRYDSSVQRGQRKNLSREFLGALVKENLPVESLQPLRVSLEDFFE